MFKSFFKKLLFNFDQLSYLVTGNYDDIASNFSNDELYNFTLASQNRCDEIKYFLQSNFGNDYYFKEFNREISALINNFNIKSIDANYISSFQGKQYAIRWNILTATFDYVKQFLRDEGVDSAFFYNLYKTSLKRYQLIPIEML